MRSPAGDSRTDASDARARAVPPRRVGIREKYDGWRMIAFKDVEYVRLASGRRRRGGFRSGRGTVDWCRAGRPRSGWGRCVPTYRSYEPRRGHRPAPSIFGAPERSTMMKVEHGGYIIDVFSYRSGGYWRPDI